MKTYFFPAVKLTLICLLFFSGVYTCAVWGIAQFGPNHGKGEVVTQAGRAYYGNIGQVFDEDRYFWSRPSAVGYNAAGSGGSNKGPSNSDYLATVQARIDTFIVHNPSIAKAEIPADMVTASGSGLDPHISLQGAWVQIERIAKVRSMDVASLQKLVLECVEQPWLGIIGTTKVNVLKLNLVLDQQS